MVFPPGKRLLQCFSGFRENKPSHSVSVEACLLTGFPKRRVILEHGLHKIGVSIALLSWLPLGQLAYPQTRLLLVSGKTSHGMLYTMCLRPWPEAYKIEAMPSATLVTFTDWIPPKNRVSVRWSKKSTADWFCHRNVRKNILEHTLFGPLLLWTSHLCLQINQCS